MSVNIGGYSAMIPTNCQSSFLYRRELEVEAILNQSLVSLTPLWRYIDPKIIRFLGDIFPIGPMKPRDPVVICVLSDYEEKPRKPSQIYGAIREENLQKGQLWDLVWLSARVRGRPDLWRDYAGSVALASSVSDGCSERRFPYLNGTADAPNIRLVPESGLGDPAREFKFLARSPEDRPLQMKAC